MQDGCGVVCCSLMTPMYSFCRDRAKGMARVDELLRLTDSYQPPVSARSLKRCQQSFEDGQMILLVLARRHTQRCALKHGR